MSCTRDGLQAATDLYLDAQTKGDPSGLPLATGLAYIENMQVVDIKTGVIQKPLKIDFHRTLIDPATCQTFTEMIVTDKTHPYVLGTRLRVNHDKIVEIESMVTQQGDWLFNADNYYKWSPDGGLGRDSAGPARHAATLWLPRPMPTSMLSWKRSSISCRGDTRATGPKAASVPAKASRPIAATVGVPAGVNIVARRFIVDETTGAVVVFCTFGVGGLPDTHLFRIEHGKLRYVHTLTHVPPGYHVRTGPPPANTPAPSTPAPSKQ